MAPKNDIEAFARLIQYVEERIAEDRSNWTKSALSKALELGDTLLSSGKKPEVEDAIARVFDASIQAIGKNAAGEFIGDQQAQLPIISQTADKLLSLGQKGKVEDGLTKAFNASVKLAEELSDGGGIHNLQREQLKVVYSLADKLVSLGKTQEVKSSLTMLFNKAFSDAQACVKEYPNTASVHNFSAAYEINEKLIALEKGQKLSP